MASSGGLVEAAAGAVAMGTGAFLTSQADDDAGQHALVS